MQTSSTWTIDTTATNVIDLQATWSTLVGTPTITSTNVAAWIPGAAAGTGLPPDAGKANFGLSTDGAGIASWRQLTATIPLLVGSCQASTAVLQVIWGVATGINSGCGDSAGTNNYAYVAANAGSTISVYFSVGLPIKLKSGSTASVYLRSQSSANTGNTDTVINTVCSGAAGPSYNATSTGTTANPGTAFTAFKVAVTGIDLTGCTGGDTVMFKVTYPSSNPGQTFILGNGSVVFSIDAG
jgi:hypothetical protein